MIVVMPENTPGPQRTSRRSRAGFVGLAALVALVSFGGAAGAGALVTGAKIKDGTLQSRDLRDGRGIRGVDVKNGSLLPSKVNPTDMPPGPVGLDGQASTVPGADGLANIRYEKNSVNFLAGNPITQRWEIKCGPGQRVIGGGAEAANANMRLEESAPLPDGSGWRVVVLSTQPPPHSVLGWAVCADPQ